MPGAASPVVKSERAAARLASCGVGEGDALALYVARVKPLPQRPHAILGNRSCSRHYLPGKKIYVYIVNLPKGSEIMY